MRGGRIFIPPIRPILHDDTTIQIYTLHAFEKITLKPIPDYRYRLDYILPSDQGPENKFDDDQIPPMPGQVLTPEQRKEAMETFNRATSHYPENNERPRHPKIILRNNCNQLSFDWC